MDAKFCDILLTVVGLGLFGFGKSFCLNLIISIPMLPHTNRNTIIKHSANVVSAHHYNIIEQHRLNTVIDCVFTNVEPKLRSDIWL